MLSFPAEAYQMNRMFLDGLRNATNLCVVAKWSRGGTHYFALAMEEITSGFFKPAGPYIANHDPRLHAPGTSRAFYEEILPQLLPAEKIAAIATAERNAENQHGIRNFFMLLLRELREAGVPLKTITWYWWGKTWDRQSWQSEISTIYHANGDVYYGNGTKAEFLCLPAA